MATDDLELDLTPQTPPTDPDTFELDVPAFTYDDPDTFELEL